VHQADRDVKLSSAKLQLSATQESNALEPVRQFDSGIGAEELSDEELNASWTGSDVGRSLKWVTVAKCSSQGKPEA
jgi:hypothetical protein